MDAIKRLTNMANMANTRLNRARAKYPASDYVNEMENRLINMTRLYPDLVVKGIHGIQLTRSKSKWKNVPPAMAEAILEEINGVGQMWVMEDKAREVLNMLGADASEENMRAIIEGAYNNNVSESAIWDLAYELRTQNQELYELFDKLHGNGVESWDNSYEVYTDMLRKILMNGDSGGGAQFPSSYGLNPRKEAKNKAARLIGKEASRSNPDPEFLASQLYNYAAAQYGTTKDGIYTPADPTTLTRQQMNSILKSFFK